MRRYCPDMFSYARRPTNPVRVGQHLVIGGSAPIVVQSMTTTSTADVESSARQVEQLADAGAQMVRLTAQGRTEARALADIRRHVEEHGYEMPLVADIHFNAALALIAAEAVSKVRINPGNFVERSAALAQEPESDTGQEQQMIEDRMLELLEVCRRHDTALRIGVNHGSLSARMVAQWGDTPGGMVHSAMEFLMICHREGFDRVVVSMKSSNPRVMVEAYRLLVATMDEAGMHYPLHLGVTEAGEGADGRIRSAVGIGALLCDGLGDTIRVSLTEPPQNEIEPARTLADYFTDREMHNYIPVDDDPLPYDPFNFRRRESSGTVFGEVRIGAGAVPVVVGSPSQEADIDHTQVELVTPAEAMEGRDSGWIACTLDDLGYELLEWLEDKPERVLVISSDNTNWVGEMRACIVQIMRHKLLNPVIIRRSYSEKNYDTLQIHAAADLGALLIDGLVDGVWIENGAADFDMVRLSLDILQASRARLSRTEIISCPGCGRTLYDLQSAARAVKERFGGYPGLKIAVMGCIVNGPGEMADADYGYVGAGAGVVNLYRGREAVCRNVPQSEALDRLEELINSK